MDVRGNENISARNAGEICGVKNQVQLTQQHINVL